MIGYVAKDMGACTYYRIALPLNTVRKYSGNVRSYIPGDSLSALTKTIESHVIAFSRPVSPEFQQIINNMKDSDKRIVIDYDDNIFRVSPMNPSYEDTGINEVFIKHKGEMMPMWLDESKRDKYKDSQLKPSFIDIERNKRTLETAIDMLSQVDLVTCTQPILADFFRQYSFNVAVLPNCVDVNLWQKLPLKEHSETRLYWSGGASHYEDWCILSDIIPKVMEKYDNVKLIIMGQKFDGTLKKIPPEKIEFHPWVATPAYPLKTAILDPDICLIPLQDNEFNQCKSPIKWIEMGALGVPCVTSNVSPYKEVATEENGIYIEDNDKDAWLEGISMLVEDLELRKSIATAAKDTVYENFDINKKWVLWKEAYEALI